jgi:hypothetical protein
MRSYAESELKSLGKPGNILAGGVPEFAALAPGSFDYVVIMGVTQYLSSEDYELLLDASARILKPGGTLAVTFQNAFFDLFTFNKYTVDFLVNELLASTLKNGDRPNAEKAIENLLKNPQKPDYSRGRARDNIFVRLTNPLLIDGELAHRGLRLKKKYFYDYFGLPPLAASTDPELAKRIAQHFEIERADSWQGHFLANAFLAECIKEK